ncbi:MAG TPA: YlxQ family RNA-binding protein [Candidatus Pseudogracilibacillus intestinigallinarum]|uniref:YlxQ family RNA-binding protein n=1 Tax=Candidatus Pseudogracilibacillus intestinigallinarum TaxID=2838742 RepID=A0A9D1PPB7_9BACI|nr:YlxQ family RNA-binding protein [Candidatus Pseudogracilibacillus intestinigallinarum]
MKSNYLNLVGLANRARKITTGEELIIKDIQAGKVSLLLIADDVGDQTKKKLQDKCTTYQVPYMEVDDRYTLGHAIGKSERVAIAILDNGFAKKIRTLLS